MGTGYNHIALTVDDLDGTLENLSGRASSPRSRRTASRRAARASASCATPTAIVELTERSQAWAEAWPRAISEPGRHLEFEVAAGRTRARAGRGAGRGRREQASGSAPA